jgi:protein-tyrosine-phosphatase
MNKPLSVLFLCTHNSARSILAEALLTRLGNGRFTAYSAGSSPRDSGKPNPLAIQVLEEAGFATADLRSKSWDEFTLPGAPVIDVVITVCGAAEETCPVFPGHPATAHWGFEDPSAGDAADDVKLAAFRATVLQISQRIELLVSLPDAALHRLALEQTIRDLASH